MTVSNLAFSWSSSPESVAAAESTGDSTALVTAVANGKATITAETARCPFSACDAAPATVEADSLSGTAGRAGSQAMRPRRVDTSVWGQLPAEELKDGGAFLDPVGILFTEDCKHLGLVFTEGR